MTCDFDQMDSSVAILHDRFPGIGGGEKFAIEAARVLDAPIYTMYVYPGTEIPGDIEVVPIQQEKYARTLTPISRVAKRGSKSTGDAKRRDGHDGCTSRPCRL